MSKPVRYFLLCAVLSLSVCLLATAAGIYMAGVGVGSGWPRWGKPVYLAGQEIGYFYIGHDITLAVGRHVISLPVNGLGCVLGLLIVSTLACWYGAWLLIRPLFPHPDLPPEL